MSYTRLVSALVTYKEKSELEKIIKREKEKEDGRMNRAFQSEASDAMDNIKKAICYNNTCMDTIRDHGSFHPDYYKLKEYERLTQVGDASSRAKAFAELNVLRVSALEERNLNSKTSISMLFKIMEEDEPKRVTPAALAEFNKLEKHTILLTERLKTLLFVPSTELENILTIDKYTPPPYPGPKV